MVNWLRRGSRAASAALVVPVLAIGVSAAAAQEAKAPRLRTGAAVPATSLAYGGGEVALELYVGNDGAVTKVAPLTSSPPFTDALTATVKSWRFDPAQDTIDERLVAVPGRVLVVAVFRAPAVYAAPTPGAETKVLGRASGAIPQPGALTMPAYPPKVFGNGTVLVEIEMAGGSARELKVLGSPSGFDAAALAAVKSWRFGPPSTPGAADPQYVYAIVAFREPVVTPGN